jgi:uncharacterized protein YdbL (DUF1318 family)
MDGSLYRALIALVLGLVAAAAALAQGNLEVDTPAISALKGAMQARHGQLAPHYASGAVGVARDGMIALRDANAVPLASRQQVSGLVAAENTDRTALYREIARANAHPEWEAEVRSTFAQRWSDKAQPGWYVQNAAGQWARK